MSGVDDARRGARAGAGAGEHPRDAREATTASDDDDARDARDARAGEAGAREEARRDDGREGGAARATRGGEGDASASESASASASASERESERESESESDSTSTSTSDASTTTDGETRARAAPATDEYDVEGRLPSRAAPTGDSRGFWTRCYHEGAKFCGLGVLLEEIPSESSSSESSSDSDSDSDSEGSRRRRRLRALDSFKSNMSEGSELDEADLNDELKQRVLEEERANIYPSLAIMEVLFKKMQDRLTKKAVRDEMLEAKRADEAVTTAHRNRRKRSRTWLLHQFVSSKFFTFLTALMIFYSTVVCGIVSQDPERWYGTKFEDISFLVLNIGFAVEAVMRIMSSGVVVEEDGVKNLVELRPLYYFKDPVNCVDFVVTLLSFSEYIVQGHALDSVRTFRLVRLLRLIQMVEDMRVILDGVIQGIMSIVWILILLTVVVYIYAVIGVTMFGGNDPRNFRSLGTAFKTVLSMTTMSDWLDFLYINYHGCDQYGYDGADASYCTNPKSQKVVATMYVMSLIVILGNIMMSLFIGVITNKMEDATLELKDSKDAKKRKRKAARAAEVWDDPALTPLKIGAEQYAQLLYHLNLLSGVKAEGVVRPLPDLPKWKYFQFWLKRMVTNAVFEWGVVMMIFAVAITSGISLEYDQQEKEWYKATETFFISVFTAELVIKFFAHLDKKLSFYTGKQRWWNVFDTFVVLIGLIPSSYQQAAVVVRLLRLLRILRLVRVIRQLQVVVLSLIAGMHSIVYVAVFMSVVFFVYAVAAVQVFRLNDPFHFSDLSNAVVTLFTVSFLEGWRPVFEINFHGCDKNLFGDTDGGVYYASTVDIDLSSNTTAVCGNPSENKVFTFFFFSSYILVSAMVLVSAFVGIIVTSMQSASTTVRRRLAAEERLKMIEDFFQLDENSSKQTVYIYELLDSGFEGELTADKIMEKMTLFDIPTNPELLKRAHQTVNGLTDAPFNEADFLLLTVLAERARKVQEKLDEDGHQGSLEDVDFIHTRLSKSGRRDIKAP